MSKTCYIIQEGLSCRPREKEPGCIDDVESRGTSDGRICTLQEQDFGFKQLLLFLNFAIFEFKTTGG